VESWWVRCVLVFVRGYHKDRIGATGLFVVFEHSCEPVSTVAVAAAQLQAQTYFLSKYLVRKLIHTIRNLLLHLVAKARSFQGHLYKYTVGR
jgi:hypothetical protein